MIRRSGLRVSALCVAVLTVFAAWMLSRGYPL